MKLQDKLPRIVEYNGRRYRVNLDFRNVLNMLDVMARDDLIRAARDYRALKCVMRKPPSDPDKCAGLLGEIGKICFPKHSGETGPKVTDFVQDADVIRAAFLQSYGINLWREKLHWLEFTALRDALPSGSRYTEILDIRTRPMPAPTKYNAEQRQWLTKAKATYAVRLTDKEAEDSYQNGLRLMAEGLLSLAEKEVKTDA